MPEESLKVSDMLEVTVTRAPSWISGWRVWYDDGSTSEGCSLEDWKALPDDGLLIRMLYFNRNRPDGKPLRRRDTGFDWYFVAPSPHGLIYGLSNDPPEEIMRRYPGAVLKRGRWASEEMIDRVNQEADHADECGCGQ